MAPLLLIVALPAFAVAAVNLPKVVAPPENAIVPPLLLIVALPALDVASKKSVSPPDVALAVPLTIPALLLIVTLPVIAVPEKTKEGVVARGNLYSASIPC